MPVEVETISHKEKWQVILNPINNNIDLFLTNCEIKDNVLIGYCHKRKYIIPLSSIKLILVE